MRVTTKKRGSIKNTMNFLNRILSRSYLQKLEQYGQMGVDALAAATPRRTGKTAASWGYEIELNDQNTKLTWTNSNVVDGVNVVVLIRYGHGTGTGGYVQGIDFIEPAMKPLFQGFADDIWKEVMRK